jgi:hypothetical protein
MFDYVGRNFKTVHIVMAERLSFPLAAFGWSLVLLERERERERER